MRGGGKRGVREGELFFRGTPLLPLSRAWAREGARQGPRAADPSSDSAIKMCLPAGTRVGWARAAGKRPRRAALRKDFTRGLRCRTRRRGRLTGVGGDVGGRRQLGGRHAGKAGARQEGGDAAEGGHRGRLVTGSRGRGAKDVEGRGSRSRHHPRTSLLPGPPFPRRPPTPLFARRRHQSPPGLRGRALVRCRAPWPGHPPSRPRASSSSPPWPARRSSTPPST
jgi:hypothetical protein